MLFRFWVFPDCTFLDISTLTPEMVTAGSHKKAWWQCSYGHVWKATIYSRAGVQQCGCPVCAGRTRAGKT